jgi:GDP-4-dehydro-6-deoxy-D-mannose reductase
LDVCELKPGRLVVTGASGFTGRHACRHFSQKGWQVIAAASPRSAPDFWRGSGAETGERCDLTDQRAVRALVAKYRPDAVLHLAAQNAVETSWRDPSDTLMRNLMATVHLLEAVRLECPDCRMLAVGSVQRPSENRLMESENPYGFSKTLQFMAAKAWNRWYGMNILVAEPSNLIGPGGSAGICGKIARWAAEVEARGGGPPFRLSSLHEKRDFLDVRDAVAAYEILFLAGTPGSVYAIESGTYRTLEELKLAFEAEAHCKLEWQIGNAPANVPVPRDTSPIRLLGWQPKIPFHQSIRDALEEERRRRQAQKRTVLPDQAE